MKTHTSKHLKFFCLDILDIEVAMEESDGDLKSLKRKVEGIFRNFLHPLRNFCKHLRFNRRIQVQNS